MGLLEHVLLFIFCVGVLLETSFAINCYQCSGSDPNSPFQCNEWLSSDIDIKPESCDNVYGAKYCVKHIGRNEGGAIKCYQCSSSKDMNCGDGMVHLGAVQPENCDNVFEAAYCIKSTSLDGGVGAKRFCSSLDLGNYCNYVQQPGDKLAYRTCIHTCTGDGCNSSIVAKPNGFTITLVLASFFFFRVYL